MNNNNKKMQCFFKYLQSYFLLYLIEMKIELCSLMQSRSTFLKMLHFFLFDRYTKLMMKLCAWIWLHTFWNALNVNVTFRFELFVYYMCTAYTVVSAFGICHSLSAFWKYEFIKLCCCAF